MRKTLMLAAAVLFVVLRSGIAAGDSTTSSNATATVDAQHAGLLNRPPIVFTDDRHAVLVIRAGYRVRIAQPSLEKVSSVTVPSSDVTVVDRLMSISVLGAALLGVGVAVLVVGLRRVLEPRSD